MRGRGSQLGNGEEVWARVGGAKWEEKREGEGGGCPFEELEGEKGRDRE